MGKILDISGKRFGKLVVVNHTGRQKTIKWVCLCDCGNTTTAVGGDIKQGKINSCGCARYDKLKTRNTIHGHCGKERLYRIWRGVISRCHFKSATSYANYGGRGIVVCDEWRRDYKCFRKWALDNGYKEGLTIERDNVNDNYSPINCRWIIKAEQSKNKRTRLKYPKRNKNGQFIKGD